MRRYNIMSIEDGFLHRGTLMALAQPLLVATHAKQDGGLEDVLQCV